MKKNLEQFLSDCSAVSSVPQFTNKASAYQYHKPFSTLLSFLKPENIVLDWGCGSGHLSAFLLYNQQNTTAFGFGETTVPDIIADNSLLTFVAADTKEPVKIPFDNNSFDLVFSLGVLEHVHESGGNQVSSLREINRILKPGGFFLCFHFPYCGSWVEKFNGVIMPLKRRKTYIHTKRFSKKDVIQLCNDSSLTLHEWGKYNFLPRNIFQKIPNALTNSKFLLTLVNTTDTTLAHLLPWFCNQSYFIAQKPIEQS